MPSVIPANPFDPEAAFVPDVLRRLFAAVDDIQREYNGTNSKKEARVSLARACEKAIEAIGDIHPNGVLQ